MLLIAAGDGISERFDEPAFLTDLRRETTDSGLSASLHGNFAP
ncbi:MAG TPA: hypothetical protein VNM92_12830 [Thermoanaerobaculia bacterium]|nr:hypothetical protein [Thermoanaerobaculia bacterium]